MARIAETGMIFIPSLGGHRPCLEEYSTPAQVEQGVNVLLDAVISLAAQQMREDAPVRIAVRSAPTVPSSGVQRL
jgi:hypothetical protein